MGLPFWLIPPLIDAFRRPYGAENAAIQRAKGGVVLPETVRKREQRAANRAALAEWKAERAAAHAPKPKAEPRPKAAPKAAPKPKAAPAPKPKADPPAEVTPDPTEVPPAPTPERAPAPEPKPKPESKPTIHRDPPPPAKVSVAPAKVKRARSASTATTFDPAPVKARKGCPTHPFGSGYCKACHEINNP